MTDWLDEVYKAGGDIERLAKAYDGWAEQYDADVGAIGHLSPTIVTSLFARLMTDVDAPVLDAGCGTGLVGFILSIVGYRAIDGIDLSPGMLERARQRAAYRKLDTAVLGETLEIPDGAYAGVVSSGVFTVGHAPASAFDEIARVLKPGGVFVVSITDQAYQDGGFGAAFDRLEAAGVWSRAATSGGYVPLPGAGDDHRFPGKVYAMRKAG